MSRKLLRKKQPFYYIIFKKFYSINTTENVLELNKTSQQLYYKSTDTFPHFLYKIKNSLKSFRKNFNYYFY